MNIFKNSIFTSSMVNTYLPRCRSRTVLELVCTGLWELFLHISFQLSFQRYHIGSLKLNKIEVLTPWKSTNAANQDLLTPSTSHAWKSVIKYLSYHWKKPTRSKDFRVLKTKKFGKHGSIELFNTMLPKISLGKKNALVKKILISNFHTSLTML